MLCMVTAKKVFAPKTDLLAHFQSCFVCVGPGAEAVVILRAF